MSKQIHEKRAKKLMKAITDLPDAMIREAEEPARIRKRRPFPDRFSRPQRIAAALCALCLLAAGGLTAHHFLKPAPSSLAAPALVPAAEATPFDKPEEHRASPDFLAAVNQFSYETASSLLSGSDKNLNYSPVSLYLSLALAASGSKGETKEQLLEFLHMEDTGSLRAQCAGLNRLLTLDNGTSRLKTASSIWMDTSVEWKRPFLEDAAEYFYAEAFALDMGDPETSDALTRWISDETEGTLSPSLPLGEDTLFMILNTVYFHDQWQEQFRESATKPGNFYLRDGSSVTCDLMSKVFPSAPFSKEEGFTRASLSLKGGGRMIFILPDQNVSPQSLMDTPEKVRELFEGEDDMQGEVSWKIPKFQFQTSLDLTDTLEELGLLSAFREDADFSPLTDTPLFLSSILQGTFIEINENGVEASAFTEIALATGAAPSPGDRAEMTLDRPFLYGITDANGVLLFAGLVEDPTAEN